jgi:hypothetical protein
MNDGKVIQLFGISFLLFAELKDVKPMNGKKRAQSINRFFRQASKNPR